MFSAFHIRIPVDSGLERHDVAHHAGAGSDALSRHAICHACAHICYAMKDKPKRVLQRLKKELNSGICISSIALAELEYMMKHSSNPIKMSRRFFTS